LRAPYPEALPMRWSRQCPPIPHTRDPHDSPPAGREPSGRLKGEPMMRNALNTTRARRAAMATAALGVLSLTMSACAGSAGSGGGGGGGEAGEGFAYDAPQEEVDAAIADLDPITIKFQPSSASPDSVMAPAGTVFKEIVEERSGGKITVELVWGQAIAGYAEVHDALSDGRLDVAYTLPVYDPAQFAAVNDLG